MHVHPKARANSTKPTAQSQNYHSSTLRSRNCDVILNCAVIHSQSCDCSRRKLAKQPRSSAMPTATKRLLPSRYLRPQPLQNTQSTRICQFSKGICDALRPCDPFATHCSHRPVYRPGGSSGQCWHTSIDPLTTYELLICHNASVDRCVTTSGPCDGTPWSPGHAHPCLSQLSHLPAAPIDQKCARSTHI